MTLNEIEQRLNALQAEKDKLIAELAKLKSEQAQVKPWRAKIAQDYFSLSSVYCVLPSTEAGNGVNNTCYKIGNYYRTRELAEQDARELALRGRVRQLRDALCEGYRASQDNINYCVLYSLTDAKYSVGFVESEISVAEIYFDTEEHAQQACDILNAERRKESGGNG